MEYVRRRRRRSRGTGGAAGKTILVLLLLAAAVYFVSASAVGTWIAQNVMAPLFGGSAAQAEGTDAADTKADDGAAEKLSADAVAEEIEVPAFSCYALQMGAYQDRENADKQADAVRARGAGGYVCVDGERYRVLAAGYGSEADLKLVREKLNEQGYDSTGYPLTTEKQVLLVTASPEQQRVIAESFNALHAGAEALLSAALTFDRERLSVEEGISRAEAIESDLVSAREAFKAAMKGGGEALDAVDGCFAAMIEAIGKVKDAKDDIACSAQWKYAQLAAASAYVGLCKTL